MIAKLTGEGEGVVKKNIDIFIYKDWNISIDMKKKVVQHVPRIKLDNVTTWHILSIDMN